MITLQRRIDNIRNVTVIQRNVYCIEESNDYLEKSFCNYIWNATWNAYRNIYYIGESNDGKVTNVSSYGKHVSR